MDNYNQGNEYYSPKSQELASESKILYELTNGAQTRAKLFNEYDRTFMKKSVDLQDEIVWSEKNISISVQKQSNIQKIHLQTPCDFQNVSYANNFDVDGSIQNRAADRSNFTMMNAQNITSQQTNQKSFIETKNNQGEEIKQQFNQSQSKTFFKFPTDKRLTEYAANSPEKIQDKSKKAQKRFQVMMYVKRFQNKILKKSPSYLFKKSLDIGIQYQFLNDKTFSIDDFKQQKNMKKHHNVNSLFQSLQFDRIFTQEIGSLSLQYSPKHALLN